MVEFFFGLDEGLTGPITPPPFPTPVPTISLTGDDDDEGKFGNGF